MSLIAALRSGARAVSPAPTQCCASCAFFCSDPMRLESAIPGLRSFGSGFAAVRANDGLCLRHERYLSAEAHCPQYESRQDAQAPGGA